MGKSRCRRRGHKYQNVGAFIDSDSRLLPVNILARCTRCGHEGWDAVPLLKLKPPTLLGIPLRFDPRLPPNTICLKSGDKTVTVDLSRES